MKVGVFGCMPRQYEAIVAGVKGAEFVYLGGRHHPIRRSPVLDRVLVVAKFAGHREVAHLVYAYGREKIVTVPGGPSAARAALIRLCAPAEPPLPSRPTQPRSG